MSGIRLLLVVVVFCLSTFLFYKAAGTLKLTKLNMISTIYYFMLLFNMIGGSLIYLGFRNHYLIQKINTPGVIERTYYILAYCAVTFPLALCIVKKIISMVKRPRKISDFVQEGVRYNAKTYNIQIIVMALIIICTLSTMYVFLHLGYIPVVSMLKGGNLNALRQSGNRNFSGNQYVKNLIMATLTPFVSYFTFIYYKITKSKTWKMLFYYMVILSVVVLTYDFSKSPIITYLMGLYLIEVMLGNVTNEEKIRKLVLTTIILILFFYLVMMRVEKSSLLSIYSGPMGRIFFTQIATLFLHVDAFPMKSPFLNGASFNGWMSFLIPNAANIRSGRVVMSIYNAQGVETNTAGVMNTLFVGEAYANYGIIGVIIAPIVFGIVIGFFAYMLPALKKRPTSILLYVQLTLQFTLIIEGGFVDIFYSASTIFLVLVTIMLYLFSSRTTAVAETALAEESLKRKRGRLKFRFGSIR